LANTRRFELEELSRYDDRGPAWYWNDIHTGEHTGTHLDAPVHWITGQDGPDVSQAPLSTLVGAAAVIDMTDRVAADPDFLLEVEHVRAWEARARRAARGRLVALPHRWSARGDDAAAFANADETARTPPVSPRSARAGWPRSRRSAGSGWRRRHRLPAPRTGSPRRSPATARSWARTSGG
jgi:kynurenine formamidase